MHRTDMAPSPINLVTTWVVYLLRMCQRGTFFGMGHKKEKMFDKLFQVKKEKSETTQILLTATGLKTVKVGL